MAGPLQTPDLPDVFPVFPLGGALLLPGGRLPLNIFEPRYLAMVDDSLGQQRIFGMVQPDRRLGAGVNGPGLYRTGCLGRIASFSETEDERYVLTLKGLSRFTIIEEIEPLHGYRRVRGALASFAADLTEAEVAPLPFARGILTEALGRYFSRVGVDANWEAIEAIPEASLVTSLGMACPFDAEEKQALLEARNAAERARTLLALLQINGFDDRRNPDSKAS